MDLPTVSSRRVRVATWSELEDRVPAYALVAGVDLVVIRYDDQVSVFFGRCLHRGALLADGRIEGPNLICGVHGWDYRLDTGVSEYKNDEALEKFEAWVDVADDVWQDQFERGVAADEFVTFFAEDDAPVGMTGAMIRDGHLNIFGMWVAPEARGLGFGRALLEAVFTWGKIRGAGSARLAVTIGNDIGGRLYANAGFEPTGETEPLRDGSELMCAWLERPL